MLGRDIAQAERMDTSNTSDKQNRVEVRMTV